MQQRCPYSITFASGESVAGGDAWFGAQPILA
jgi:hypothetical protein